MAMGRDFPIFGANWMRFSEKGLSQKTRRLKFSVSPEPNHFHHLVMLRYNSKKLMMMYVNRCTFVQFSLFTPVMFCLLFRPNPFF